MEDSTSSAHDLSKDPKRKAKSSDPGWKYAFWPDLNNKDIVQCCLCNKKMHAWIRRLKLPWILADISATLPPFFSEWKRAESFVYNSSTKDSSNTWKCCLPRL
ncbi:hypothetical protein OROMI_008002 [Orobanche minor]